MEESEDPDWRVSQRYLLIKGEATEPFIGIEILWKTGKSKRHHNYPDFGKYMPLSCFKAAPCAWADLKY